MISFIILTWNSERYIEECISYAIEKCEEEKINYEILVVDNGSSDSTKDILKRYKNKVNVIWLGKNYGTTYSRNLAIKKARGNVICFLDSDAVLKKGSLKSLYQKLISTNDIGIIAPKLVLPDGSIQKSVKKFPALWHKAIKIKKIYFGKDPKKSEYYKNIPNDEVTVDHAISACWFFRKELTEFVGFLDERIFYSPEDIDYCLRVWKKGGKILYYPFFEVLHYTQQISHKKRTKFFLLHCLGLLYYFKKHKYVFLPPSFGEWESQSKRAILENLSTSCKR
jgi:hypothetical protein